MVDDRHNERYAPTLLANLKRHVSKVEKSKMGESGGLKMAKTNFDLKKYGPFKENACVNILYRYIIYIRIYAYILCILYVCKIQKNTLSKTVIHSYIV